MKMTPRNPDLAQMADGPDPVNFASTLPKLND